MIDNDPITSEQLQAQARAIEIALQESVRDALIDHKRTGDPIVVYEDGHIRWIPADEIIIPDPPSDATSAQ